MRQFGQGRPGSWGSPRLTGRHRPHRPSGGNGPFLTNARRGPIVNRLSRDRWWQPQRVSGIARGFKASAKSLGRKAFLHRDSKVRFSEPCSAALPLPGIHGWPSQTVAPYAVNPFQTLCFPAYSHLGSGATSIFWSSSSGRIDGSPRPLLAFPPRIPAKS